MALQLNGQHSPARKTRAESPSLTECKKARTHCRMVAVDATPRTWPAVRNSHRIPVAVGISESEFKVVSTVYISEMTCRIRGTEAIKATKEVFKMYATALRNFQSSNAGMV